MSVLSQPRYHDEAATFDSLRSNGVGGRRGLLALRRCRRPVCKLDGVHGKSSNKNLDGALRRGLKK